jgi:hypothetical protein
MYQARYLVGNVLSTLTDLNGAIAQYHRAIQSAPDQPRTIFNLLFSFDQSRILQANALEQALGQIATTRWHSAKW